MDVVSSETEKLTTMSPFLLFPSGLVKKCSKSTERQPFQNGKEETSCLPVSSSCPPLLPKTANDNVHVLVRVLVPSSPISPVQKLSIAPQMSVPRIYPNPKEPSSPPNLPPIHSNPRKTLADKSDVFVMFCSCHGVAHEGI
jgi:hypothetical protein